MKDITNNKYASTFGSTEKWKSLLYIINNLPNYDDNKQHYLSKFIIDFNTLVKKIEKIEDNDLKKYMIRLVKNDYKSRTNSLFNKYEIDLVTHLKNFIKAKLNALLNN